MNPPEAFGIVAFQTAWIFWGENIFFNPLTPDVN